MGAAKKRKTGLQLTVMNSSYDPGKSKFGRESEECAFFEVTFLRNKNLVDGDEVVTETQNSKFKFNTIFWA